MMWRVVLLLALGPWSVAHADFKDGNDLYEDMRTGGARYLNVIGYITGVADTLRGVTFCPQNNVTAGQLTDLVRDFLYANPDKRHYTASSIISVVISDVWPCKRKGQAL